MVCNWCTLAAAVLRAVRAHLSSFIVSMKRLSDCRVLKLFSKAPLGRLLGSAALMKRGPLLCFRTLLYVMREKRRNCITRQRFVFTVDYFGGSFSAVSTPFGSESRLIFPRFSRSTRFAHFCTVPNLSLFKSENFVSPSNSSFFSPCLQHARRQRLL